MLFTRGPASQQLLDETSSTLITEARFRRQRRAVHEINRDWPNRPSAKRRARLRRTGDARKSAWSIRSPSFGHSHGCVQAGKIALPHHVGGTSLS